MEKILTSIKFLAVTIGSFITTYLFQGAFDFRNIDIRQLTSIGVKMVIVYALLFIGIFNTNTNRQKDVSNSGYTQQ